MVLSRSGALTLPDDSAAAVLSTELHELKSTVEEAQASFEAAHTSLLSQNSHNDAAIASRDIVAHAFASSVKELKRATTCSHKLQELIADRLSRLRQPRTSPRIVPVNQFGTRVQRKAEEDIWSHRPDRIFDVGTEVAALVDEHNEPHLWILASVKRFDQMRKRYTVVDEHAGDDKATAPPRKTYVLDAERVLSLPNLMQYPISRRIEFNKDESVLAIYPKTTVFYPARVISGPRKLKHPYYLLQFHDDQGVHRKVQAHHVVLLPARYYNQDASFIDEKCAHTS